MSLAQLAPFVGPDSLVHVDSRLRFSSLSNDAKHPIVLPSKAHIIMLLIRHYHLSCLYGGPKVIYFMIVHKLWILAGRDAIRRDIFSCVPYTCHKARRPMAYGIWPRPRMADIPYFRVQPH